MTDALRRGRDAYERQAWREAHVQLAAADLASPLAPEDRERLAIAAFLIGRDDDVFDHLARAHQEHLEQGHAANAARCAFWLGFRLIDRGDHAQGSGWLARAGRVLDDGKLDCVERGFLLLPVAFQRVAMGDCAAAYDTFGQAVAIGQRFGDRDLVILARNGQGRSLIQQGRLAEGAALLDEAMVGVTAGEASAIVAGLVYCSVLSACHEMFDWRRAREWTAALTRWCAAQPDLVSYRGECQVRRAEVLRLQGAWPTAMEEAQRAQVMLSSPPGQPAVAAAFYQVAELHRLRGDFAHAEEAYRQAAQWARKPQPGLAQLRLAQGQVEAARAAIRRTLDEAKLPRLRAVALGPCVEIMLAAGDVAAARAAADELAAVATQFDAPFVKAVAAYALGAVLLAEGDRRGALETLRTAWSAWMELDAPYEVARTRVLMGLACRQLADDDAARVELEAARDAFRSLGAAPDLARVDALARPAKAAPGGLSAREIEVLHSIAAGKSNRAIAQELGISEKTVARHVSNIFTKLGLASRAAATAYAFQHGLA